MLVLNHMKLLAFYSKTDQTLLQTLWLGGIMEYSYLSYLQNPLDRLTQ